ncbi:MAG: hypothetical protein DME76_14890 [Verrucomicrobia bacterium]|nr:MAG: hypothetical protein DME76_14890 [Verrucomicrobiota bacterium]
MCISSTVARRVLACCRKQKRRGSAALPNASVLRAETAATFLSAAVLRRFLLLQAELCPLLDLRKPKPFANQDAPIKVLPFQGVLCIRHVEFSLFF